ncbi:MAG: amino acid ABC transporter permease [Oscillospiraceae bacterium]|jgi:polar amino acid transport system permease protein|nr:amino acid ABC transporter permease [Oscillospiraceae bacterium]
MPSAIELDRRAYRRKQSVRSALLSCVSLIVFAAAVWLALARSEGWTRVRETFFSPRYFIESLPVVLQGLMTNLRVLASAVAGVAVLATLIALTRTTISPVLFPLRALATVYTDVFRGMPMIIVLYLIGFGIPGLRIFGRIDSTLLGTIAVILVYSAYVAEVIRAGIEAVHPSQRAAARSLGLSHSQTMRIIVLPQAVRKMVPALMNDFVAMQKDVGLVSVLGAIDAVRSAQIMVAKSYNFTPYVASGLLFILMSLPFIHLTDWYAARLKRREQAGGAV